MKKAISKLTEETLNSDAYRLFEEQKRSGKIDNIINASLKNDALAVVIDYYNKYRQEKYPNFTLGQWYMHIKDKNLLRRIKAKYEKETSQEKAERENEMKELRMIHQREFIKTEAKAKAIKEAAIKEAAIKENEERQARRTVDRIRKRQEEAKVKAEIKYNLEKEYEKRVKQAAEYEKYESDQREKLIESQANTKRAKEAAKRKKLAEDREHVRHEEEVQAKHKLNIEQKMAKIEAERQARYEEALRYGEEFKARRALDKAERILREAKRKAQEIKINLPSLYRKIINHINNTVNDFIEKYPKFNTFLSIIKAICSFIKAIISNIFKWIKTSIVVFSKFIARIILCLFKRFITDIMDAIKYNTTPRILEIRKNLKIGFCVEENVLIDPNIQLTFDKIKKAFDGTYAKIMEFISSLQDSMIAKIFIFFKELAITIYNL